MITDGSNSENRQKAVQALLFDSGGQSPSKAAWRPIHYLGSKLRLIDQIVGILDELDPERGTVCDLFAGSGTVALSLAQSRNVVAADIQEYSRAICAALLEQLLPVERDDSLVSKVLTVANENHASMLLQVHPLIDLEKEAVLNANDDPELLCSIVDHGSLISNDHSAACDRLANAKNEVLFRIDQNASKTELAATRFYGGLYFAYDQALWIDALSKSLSDIGGKLETIGLGAVLSTASDIVNTVGKQFAQPIRPRNKDGSIKMHLVRQMVRDRTIDVLANFEKWFARYLSVPRERSHVIVKGDFKDVLCNHCSAVSVVYADPPYTRDHYSRFYHVLETLSLRDTPEITTTLLNGTGAVSRGIYREDRHQSPFCIKSQAPNAFRDLFTAVKSLGVPLVCSYSPFVSNGHPRLMKVEAVVELAQSYFKSVEVRLADGVTHSKLNKTELQMETGENAEVFIVCR